MNLTEVTITTAKIKYYQQKLAERTQDVTIVIAYCSTTQEVFAIEISTKINGNLKHIHSQLLGGLKQFTVLATVAYSDGEVITRTLI